ncbi:hypothetical protein NQ314_013628 [Rhamnusium bicolor]|uniref:Uncharacterized protein n=1 Tax=Rhamnusium bicolor TaxID=1586634 RepID=A0AAV8X5W4_9CUCU|nr:hypothetical protein NQ314_013628 [Rhamnusium bicolor]
MGEVVIPLINDGRLAARILINEKIRELMDTVLHALEQSNNEKLDKLVEIANDTSMLKKIKTRDLDIRTLSGSLEHLVKHIRQNVLQLSSQNVWSKLREEQVFDTILQSKFSSSSLPKIKMVRKQINDAIIHSTRNPKLEVPTKKLPTRRSSEDDKRKGRYSTPNYIARNIEAAAKVKRIEYDMDEEETIPSKRASIDSGRSKRRSLEQPSLPKPNIQSFLPPVVKLLLILIHFSASLDSQMKPNKKKSVDSHESKYHIKQTTCPACMEKWKTPLPSPKTPRVKKSSVLPGCDYPVLKTNSQNRISMLISKEMYKLQSYDRKYSIENESPKRPVLKKKEIEHDKFEVVNLNPMDLAKIEQEIKEKETQKKLEKFLKEIA